MLSLLQVHGNRMLFSFNYKPSILTSFQIGYLHQFDYEIENEIGRDFLLPGFLVIIFCKELFQQAKPS